MVFHVLNFLLFVKTLVLNQGQFWSPVNIWQHLETFLIDTSGDGMLSHLKLMEAMDAVTLIVQDSFLITNKQLTQNAQALKLRSSELRRRATHIKKQLQNSKESACSQGLGKQLFPDTSLLISAWLLQNDKIRLCGKFFLLGQTCSVQTMIHLRIFHTDF